MLETLLIRSRAVPPEPPRRRGATSVGPERDRFGVLRGVLSAVPWLQVGLGATIVLLAAMVPWATDRLLTAMDQQIIAVDVRGDFVGDSSVAVERAAGAWIGKSYFATDLAEVKAELERRPWVASAAVRRVWPGRLEIDIREKKPLAYWTDGRLVSRSGELFLPPNPEVAGRLPRLAGPDERVREVISMARAMSDQLAGYGLGFAGLSLEQRGAWTLTLSNGIEVVLGRDKVEQRFERFITVYENRLASRVDEVSRVDARYSNGVAVQWKSDVATAAPKS
ncbi:MULTISPECIES: cell division protein FtsQ/DivIB [Marinobacter]|jgi:cell division protein FtsQ|uniref:Cell division protein FtsQ n=2 Tax=Marinobacter TaxID=2742 RepID=A0A455W9L3_MARNT|nr:MULTISPECIES: cell division protein FtsQ/DivIB [Marinobacter]KXO07919.1 Cell division protein FtsQ [Marinobacter excellens LAMA 842]MAO13968.1 cell division protein FtsQ [Marinobacter sp.]BBJ02943.1 cell division protein FtsQ [Marinobacter nauticus]